VSAASDRLNDVFQRVLPIVLGVIMVAAGYYWLLQPGLASYLRLRNEARPLEARVRLLEEAVVRNRGIAWPDETQAIKLFEQRVPKEDYVADVAERLTRAVTESATDGKLRNLALGAGSQPTIGPASAQARPAAASAEVETIDPRWSLFPYSLSHTPLTLSFDAPYETITNFFSKIRDLPTAIEIRSVTLTRGLPLMNVELTVFVFRRGDFQPASGATAAPPEPAPGMLRPPNSSGEPFNPLAPRVIEGRGPGG